MPPARVPNHHVVLHGVQASLGGGGVKEEAEGEVVVDEGEGDGDRDGVEEIDPPNQPPPLQDCV